MKSRVSGSSWILSVQCSVGDADNDGAASVSMTMAVRMAAVIEIEKTRRAIALTPKLTGLRISMMSLPVRTAAPLPAVTS
jgi:hypothetical protein